MIIRFIQLQLGLILCALGFALVVKANLGADPWTVFHVGIANKLELSLGVVIQLTGLIFMLAAWAFLRAPVGIGSICNIILIGPFINLFLPILSSSSVLWISYLKLFCGVVIIGLATALYISAEMGAGPRDSFILGLSQRSGYSIQHTRMAVEVLALAAGFFLDGPIGVGTVIFALAVGPLMQFFLGRLRRLSVLNASKK